MLADPGPALGMTSNPVAVAGGACSVPFGAVKNRTAPVARRAPPAMKPIVEIVDALVALS